MSKAVLAFLSEQLSINSIGGQLFWALVAMGLNWLRQQYKAQKSWVSWAATFLMVVIGLRLVSALLSPTVETPRLSVNVNFVRFIEGTRRDGGGQEPLALVTLDVRNSGAPSIADRWVIRAVPAGTALELEGRLRRIPDEGLPLWPPPGKDGPEVRAREEDALYNKVENTPIPRGAKQAGHLMFGFPNGDISSLSRLGTKIVVSCEDVDGRTVSGEFVLAATGTGPVVLPGTRR